MLQWMMFCLAVAVLLCAGAMALEAALRTLRRPARWVWAGAMALSLAIPALSRWMPRAPEPVPAAASAPGATGGGTGMVIALPAAAGRMDPAVLDGPLRLGWMLASALAAASWLTAWAALHRRRRAWKAERVDGVDLLVSERTGPAVFGVLRGRIVVPAWVLRDAAPDARALLLEHEAEHLRAGDPRLLAFGLACVTLMPWSPAAWWQLRRLRLAIEMDCDGRVLARRNDVRGYGTLLLEVGRRAARGRLPVLSFGEPASFLERRIRMMTRPAVRAPLPRAAALCGLSLALLAAACEAPGPVNPAPATRDRAYTAPEAAVQAALTPREAMQRYYPDVLTRGAGEQNRFFFVIGQDGQVAEHHRDAAEAPRGEGLRAERVDAFRTDPEAIAAIDVMKMTAGQMGPGPVNIIWIQLKAPGQTASAERAPGSAPAAPSGAAAGAGRGANIRINQSAGQGAQRVTVTPAGTTPPAVGAIDAPGTPPLVDAARVRGAIQQHLPNVAREGTTAENVWFVSDAAGRVVAFGEGTAGMNDALRPDDIASVQVFKGESVTLNGHEIPVIWAVRKN